MKKNFLVIFTLFIFFGTTIISQAATSVSKKHLTAVYLEFNSNPIFLSQDVRETFAMAVNRDEIVKKLGNKNISKASGFSKDSNMVGYNLEEAKNNSELTGIAGKTFTLGIVNEKRMKNIAETLKSQFGLVGINIEIKAIEPTKFVSAIEFEKVDLFLQEWEPEMLNFEYGFPKDNRIIPKTKNYFYELLEKEKVETDLEKKKELFQQLADILNDDVAAVPLIYLY